MSGFCSAHIHYEPGCPQCEATHGKNIEIIDTLKKVIPDETSDVDVTIEE